MMPFTKAPSALNAEKAKNGDPMMVRSPEITIIMPPASGDVLIIMISALIPL